MNSNFNRQFILTDFRLLTNRDFLRFIGSSEYATYLVLRRYVWRSSQPHYMGLHNLYQRKRLLTSSIERDKISEVTGVEPDNISRHMTALVKKGVIRRIRTGRQNIYVLGEWIDVRGDGRFRDVEWFYLDGTFGIPKTDLTHSDRSELTPASGQSRPVASDNNREGNTEENNVSNGDMIRRLPDLDQPAEKIEYLAGEMVKQLGDQHSMRFYQLAAGKIPEHVIWQALAEVQKDGANDPPRAFTYKLGRYAAGKLTGSHDNK